MTDPVQDQLNTALSGRYRVERRIGEGGMATVYLADDLKHDRKVALKVLKPEVAGVIGAERFLAEIKTTANLQHPHILPLFDSGEAESHLFYVMPFMDGESLRARLQREHELPVEDAVRIASNVAEALDYAHRKGVVHRDIKPANVLLVDGQPVVADFGIALAIGAAGGGRLTQTGVTMGTPDYMSPEQTTGDHDVGPSTDIYALGCLLYEMLCGEPPFRAPTAQAVLLKIMTEEAPTVDTLRKSVPANVKAVVAKALEKLPADRFHDAGEIPGALADPGFTHGGSPTGAMGSGARRWSWVTTAFATLSVVLAFVALWALPGDDPTVSRFSINLPPGQSLATATGSRVSMAPDGRAFAFLGQVEGEGASRIWIRDLDRLDATPLPGTEDAFSPSFSPDGRSLAFRRGSSVMTLDRDGGPPIALAEVGAGDYRGTVAWGPDGFVYLAQQGLWRVRATGGEWEAVVPRDVQGRFHLDPDILPNGNGAVFTLGLNETRSSNVIAVADFGTADTRILTDGAAARYVDTGDLMVVRGNGSLEIAPFDQDRLELTGPFTSLGVVVGLRAWGAADLSVSRTGSLLYMSGVPEPRRQVVWVDPSGFETPIDPAWHGAYESVELSPDGSRLAVGTGFGAEPQLWIKSLPDGPLTRLTLEGELNRRPTWSEDGEHVMFVTLRGEYRSMFRKRADGAGAAEPVLQLPEHVDEAEWGPGGEWLVFRTGISGGEGRDIYAWRVEDDEQKTPIAANPNFDERDPALSPDGRWIAYTSMESGTAEVYVRSFPDAQSRRIQVSRAGGSNPVWAHNGGHLFYEGFQEGVRYLLAAEITTDPVLRVRETRALFPVGRYRVSSPSGFDVTSDDGMFVMIREDNTPAEGELILVQNFRGELRGPRRD